MTMTTKPSGTVAGSEPATARRWRSRRRPSASRKLRRAGWLMVAPALGHSILWIAIPVLATLVLSFTDYRVISAPRWVGLDNYIEIWNDAVFRKATWNTIVYTFFTVPVSMAVAVVIAVLLNQRIVGRTLYRAAFFLPHVTATVAIAMVWLWMYNPQYGLLNGLLSIVGLPGQVWLGNPDWALWSVIIVGIWQGIGIKMLIYLAALQNIDPNLYEAASIDGASKIQQFFSVTLPMLKPATFFVFVVSIIGAFQVFDQIYVLTDGGPANATTMMTYEVYRSAFQNFRMGMACAQSVVLFAFLIVLTVVNRRLTGGDDT
ncbi:carbohydrate ABC transporter permease [Phytoactinopolyspora halotolerans]|uniref:Sugar ABC transporter permease n=1 Tax=Phytoactinopolyspora halotolerans TaxID=1981512 RepID=A0A6L9SA10_9ACTN|nr:sugar ABC transporter permease [Phytoactinopolyspora halotolerans]NEE01919.1 sugar ABC transporter permease [Phytoactinopolyspora halotolerans]